MNVEKTEDTRRCVGCVRMLAGQRRFMRFLANILNNFQDMCYNVNSIVQKRYVGLPVQQPSVSDIRREFYDQREGEQKHE